ncbi:hypothetical protein T190_00630 [Sinorhizobium meliloti CCBAU 01290]|nr:hypothetical protein T190_00630 [Sinorhizobium meliloti CCBAU 01290]
MKKRRGTIDENQPFDRDERFDALIDSMRRVRPLALVGAGASVDSGYPTWERLLRELEEEVLKRPGVVAPKHMSVIKDLPDPAWQAEEFYNLLGEKASMITFDTRLDDTGGGTSSSHRSGRLSAYSDDQFRAMRRGSIADRNQQASKAGGLG